MSSRILEEIRVLYPQQPPKHSVTTIEALLRRVNDVGKSLARSKIIQNMYAIEFFVFRSGRVSARLQNLE